MLYTVKIATDSGQDKYYVGSTTVGKRRLEQHATLGANCAEFVKRHAQGDPSKLSFSTHRFACKGGGGDIEVAETREAQIRAILHGVDHVSGGEVTSRQPASETRRAICHNANLCQGCGLPGHFVGQCHTPKGKAAAWFALFDVGDGKVADLTPVPWDEERALYLRLEPELCHESTFGHRTDVEEWVGFRHQVFLVQGKDPQRLHLGPQTGLEGVERACFFSSGTPASAALPHSIHSLRIEALAFALQNPHCPPLSFSAIHSGQKNSNPSQKWTMHHQYRGGLRPLTQDDSSPIYLEVPTVTYAQRMRQAAFSRAWLSEAPIMKRKRVEEGEALPPFKLCRGESPFVPAVYDLQAPYTSLAEESGSTSTTYETRLFKAPPPPYARRFHFVDGPPLLISGSVLATVPGSKLDELAHELPERRGNIDRMNKIKQWYHHSPIHVDYDRSAFEYLVSRMNQLRCHRRIDSPRDFPVVTEASLPRHIDPLCVSILAEVLGVTKVLGYYNE